MNSHSARAWKLPAFALFYIVVSYLADTLAEAWYQDLHRGYPLEWFKQPVFSYIHMWFSNYALLTAPAWLLFHLALLFTGLRYYRSGSSHWGWGLALSALACSAVGGFHMDMIFLTLESVIQHAR